MRLVQVLTHSNTCMNRTERVVSVILHIENELGNGTEGDSDREIHVCERERAQR